MADIKLSTPEQQASYCFGRQVGEQLRQSDFDGFCLEALQEGIVQAFADQASVLTDEEMHAAFQVVAPKIEARREQQAKVAAAEGEAMLTENGARDEVTVLASGLQYEVISTGEGEAKPAASDSVRVHYHGMLIDGTVFDSSYERGTPAEFPLRGVIKGWTEGLQLMPVGSKWRFYIPHELAYGAHGSPGAIPPYAALVFDVELLDIL